MILDIKQLKQLRVLNRSIRTAIDLRNGSKEGADSENMEGIGQNNEADLVSQTGSSPTDTANNLKSMPLEVVAHIWDFIVDRYSQGARNVIEALYILYKTKSITPDDLPEPMRNKREGLLSLGVYEDIEDLRKHSAILFGFKH